MTGLSKLLVRQRLGFPAPIDVLLSYREREATDLNIVKAARAALVWRTHRKLGALVAALRYSGWLLRFPSDLVRFLLRHGMSTRRQFGRSIAGQVADMVRVAVVNGVMPRDYYFGGLARHAGSDNIFRYVPQRFFGGVVVSLARLNDPTIFELAKNKLAFERRCRAERVPVVETVAVATADKVEDANGASSTVLPDDDLIIKPLSDTSGRGIERWLFDGQSYRRSETDKRLSRAELLAHASKLARGRHVPFLIQKRLVNSPELQPMAGSALATTRLVTIFNETNEPEVVEAFYRTSAAPNAVVDNFHAGGMLHPIDVVTGRLGAGLKDEPWPSKLVTRHPLTGADMVGRPLPGWEEMRMLALRLHRLFPGFVVVGWDIALTSAGPVVTEANTPPGASINRQGSFGGLVGTRLFALLAFHARRWLEENEPPDSRWRFSG